MNVNRSFNDNWEPAVLADSVLAEGTWEYQGKVRHSVRLLRRTWDYTATDIPAIENAMSGSINCDYIDYAISEDGNVFFWEFKNEGGCTTSPHFSSVEGAKTHFLSYDRPSKIRWHADS